MNHDLHPQDDALDGYLNGAVASIEAREITAHLAQCATCRDRLVRSDRFATSVSDVKRSISGAPRDEHLSFDDQIAPYVDGRLGSVDAEIVESHLESCAQCADEVEDLRQFRDVLQSAETEPATRSPFIRSPGPWIAAAAALIILLGIAWWRDTRRPLHERHTPEVLQHTTTAAARSVSEAPVATISDESGTIAVQRDGTVRGLPAHDPHWDALIADALRNRKLSVPPIPEFQQREETLLGSSKRPSEIHLLEPVNVVLADDRPTFRWTAPSNGRYVVEVYDHDFKLVAASPRLRRGSWAIDRPLQRSAIYSWQIVARIHGREMTAPVSPSPPATFKVVSASEAAEIQRARSIRPPSHLLLAAVYAKAGLLREAENEIRTLADHNADSPVPAALMRSLRAIKVE